VDETKTAADLLRKPDNVSKSKGTIAAVVVTYNRKNLLGECLDSLLRQTHPLDGICIVDNHSTDGTYEALLDRELVPLVTHFDDGPSEVVRSVPLPDLPGRCVQVRYIRMPENTGGAGGFHEGMKRAIAAGFDWLWLMDDDLRTAPEALAVLVQRKEVLAAAQDRPFILNSLVLSQSGTDGDELAFPLQELSPHGYPKIGIYHWRLSAARGQVRDGLYRWICPFNGTFVPARAIREIGLPNKEFYIWGDERDWLWRAVKKFDVYTVIDSTVFHPSRRADTFSWQQYYFIRNMFIVNRHFNFPTLRNLRLILLSLARGLCHGRWGLMLVCRAIRDGLAGRLGRREDMHP
jgi:rhamnopyranosyl-N-acetylglucosaminyl-diphospho-decaprenol beta-1,3/1,4-galactofuranosyltransferase